MTAQMTGQMSGRMTGRRFFTGLGVFAVAGVAGAISYSHQQHLAGTHGQPWVLSLIWPLCVDGLVASTGIAIATDRANGDRPRPWALAGFWIGVVVSVATNWLATTGGIVNHGVSAFPALAFLLAVESLSSTPRPRTTPATRTTDAADTPDIPTAPMPVPEAATTSDPAATMPARITRPKSTRRPDSAVAVAKAAAKLPGASLAEIAAKAKVSERTVRRHLDPAPTAPTGLVGGNLPAPFTAPAAQTQPVNGAAVTAVPGA